MTTIMQKQKNYLLRRFHALLGQTGAGTEGKRAMLASYGVESSRDLSAHELLDLCHKLEMQLHPDEAEKDKWRKRLMAAIGGWLKALKRQQNPTVIKAIACRAAQADDFNKISKERLVSLYNAFSKKQKDLQFVEELTKEELDYLTYTN